MKYYSQIGQDQYFIENVCKKKKNGFFLDIGAHDGLIMSNTAALEFEFDWSGICVEANPDLFKQLINNRPNSHHVNCAAWSTETTLLLEIPANKDIKIRPDLLSRITGTSASPIFDPLFSEVVTLNVQSRTISNIVNDIYGLPYKFDYMSLDVEGSELEVLKGIDFTRIDIGYMSIEYSEDAEGLKKLSDFLCPKGYELSRTNRWDVEFRKNEEF